MSQYCPSVQKSNVQRAFVMLETATGKLEKPTAAGFILPAGRGSISQTPTFTDSTELSDTLDVVSQSRDAMPPGDWSLPMVARLSADAEAPQGDALFQAAMGKKDTSVSGMRKYLLDTCRPTVSIWLQNDVWMRGGIAGMAGGEKRTDDLYLFRQGEKVRHCGHRRDKGRAVFLLRDSGGGAGHGLL